MNEQAQTIPPPPPQAASGIDIGSVVNRAIQIMSKPKETWVQIKSEGKSVADIYLQYFVIILLLKPISQFVQGSIVGFTNPVTKEVVRAGFFSGLIWAVISYGVALGITYVAALVIEKLAPNFGGSCSRSDAFALSAYSLTASCIGAAFGIIPIALLGFLGTLVGLYSLYLFYSGIETMTGVPAAKKLSFFAVYIVAMALVFIALAIVTMVFGAGMFFI